MKLKNLITSCSNKSDDDTNCLIYNDSPVDPEDKISYFDSTKKSVKSTSIRTINNLIFKYNRSKIEFRVEELAGSSLLEIDVDLFELTNFKLAMNFKYDYAYYNKYYVPLVFKKYDV